MRNCRNYNKNHFFLFEICIHYCLYREFSSLTFFKYHPHLKCQFPPKIPIWSKSLLYKWSEKWLSLPPPHYQKGGCKLWTRCTSHIIWTLFLDGWLRYWTERLNGNDVTSRKLNNTYNGNFVFKVELAFFSQRFKFELGREEVSGHLSFCVGATACFRVGALVGFLSPCQKNLQMF